jgi:hypothetical protein
MREEAPGLLEEAVKTLVVSVHGLSGTSHGRSDVLNREEFRAPPVRGLGLFLAHEREPLRCALVRGQLSSRLGPARNGTLTAGQVG